MQQYTQKRKQAGPAPAACRPRGAEQLPNSVRMAMAETMPSEESVYADALKAKFMEHQLPSAEREADRIASGIHASTPEQVKAQLGEKMGADFSSVRFHTDGAAAGQAEQMGARAFTTGRDVYFGQGGFDAATAAHELVHTVQQGSVAADMSTLSAPAGEVQMKPETGNAFTRFFSKVYSNTFGAIKRSHARARADVIQNRDALKKMGLWRKIQYAFTHPAALIGGLRSKNVARFNDVDRWDNEDARVKEYLKDKTLVKRDWIPSAQQGQQGQQSQPILDKGREPGEDGFWPTTHDMVMDNLVEDGGALIANQSEEKEKWYKKGLLGMNDTAKNVKSIYDTVRNSHGAIKNIGGLVQSGMEFKDSLESGVRGSTTEKGTEFVEGMLEGASGAFDLAKNIQGFIDKDKLETFGKIGGTESGFTKLISGGEGGNLSTGTLLKGASAVLKTGKGAIQFIANASRHGSTKALNKKWDKQMAEQANDANVSDEDKERNKMMHQSSFFARKNAKAGMIKGTANLVDGLLDAGSMLNPLPLLGTPISMVQKGINIGINAIAGKVKKNTNTAMLNEEMDLDNMIEDYAKKLVVKRQNDKRRTDKSRPELDTQEKIDAKWESLGESKRDEIRRVAKHVILKAHGFTSGKRSEAAGRMILNRSEYLTKHANDDQSSYKGETAELIDAMGVNKRKDGEYNSDDVATQMGLEGGEEGLESIQRSRASTLKWYARKSRFRDFLKWAFLGGK